MEFVALKKHIKENRPRPCYALFGDDDFVISRAISIIGSLASEPKPFNIVDKEFSSARELENELLQLPLMGDYRVITARGKVDIGAVEEYLKKPNPSTVLVLPYYIPHDSWSHSAQPTIPKGAEPVDCNRLDIKVISAFVRAVTDKTEAKISDEAIRLLSARCGGYMSRINSEAQKLSFLRAKGEITVDDIASSVEADTEFVVFELSDCILARNPARALAIVDGMEKNNDLVAAFTMLYNRFKRIFAAAVEPDGLAALGVKPYQAGKLKAESGKFSKARLKEILDMLAKADYNYKTGAMSQYDALTAFVAYAAGGDK